MGLFLTSFILAVFVMFIVDDELAVRPYIPRSRANKMTVISGILFFVLSMTVGYFIS